jgi:hypothetical protein
MGNFCVHYNMMSDVSILSNRYINKQQVDVVSNTNECQSKTFDLRYSKREFELTCRRRDYTTGVQWTHSSRNDWLINQKLSAWKFDTQCCSLYIAMTHGVGCWFCCLFSDRYLSTRAHSTSTIIRVDWCTTLTPVVLETLLYTSHVSKYIRRLLILIRLVHEQFLCTMPFVLALMGNENCRTRK